MGKDSEWVQIKKYAIQLGDKIFFFFQAEDGIRDRFT